MNSIKLLLNWQPLLLFALLVYVPSFSQLRWDGEAGDGQWMTAKNWAGDVLPGITDDVVLDNALLTGSFTVTLPGGNSSVQIRSISISPGSGNTIELILPTTNVAMPAFKVSGAVYGMVIGNGGIFKNASGADNGSPVEIADSLKINNGGWYIQNSSSSHAPVVAVLSKVAGTEEGIFEFDIPSASNTISLSGRTYGKLVFLSNAMNGAITYTASGTNTVTVKNDLQIGPGVTLSLNLADTLFIGRDLIQQGGTINLGNAARKLVTVINRHLVQSSTGVIGETGTAFPELVIGGIINQQIDCKGIIKDNISVKINNAAGATLTSPWSLPYKLSLANGKITTSAVNILRLLPGCSIAADSTAENSFIDGPLRKEGLSSDTRFLFPVGKNRIMRWLELKNASGNFNVEFFDSNPVQISNTYGAGIVQLSQTGYWTIKADANPSPAALVELSFNGINSGMGADLSLGRVAKLSNNVWLNYGNTAFTGTVGYRGSIVSNTVAAWSPVADSFALSGNVLANGSLALVDDTMPRNRVNTVSNAGLRLQLLAVTFPSALMLTYRAVEKTPAKLCVVDNSGRIIKLINTILEKGVNRLPVEMPILSAGIYSIQAFIPKGPSNVLRFVFIR
jgi:hypothetical protein